MRGNLEQGRIKVRIPSVSSVLIGLLEYVWVIFVVLNGNSVYHANAERSFYLLELAVLMTFVLLAANILCYRAKPSKNSVLGAVIVMAYSAVYLLIMQRSMSAKNFIELFIIGAPLLYMLFAELYRQERLLQLLYRIVDIICLLALISLIFWFMGEVFGIIRPNGYIKVSWGTFNVAEGYYGLHYAFQMDTTFFPEAYLFRNSSIFTEAPMFNLWLNIALAIEVFLKPKVSKLRIGLLGLTVLTTLSVTGILFLVICVILSAMLHLQRMNRAQKTVFFLAALVVIPLLCYVVIKSMALKADTQSYEVRLSDYGSGIRLWMDYPIFGAGFGNLTAFQPYSKTTGEFIGYSNSIVAVLGTGGLWMALLYYISYVGMLFPRLTGSKRFTCFGVCMMFLFITTISFARYIGIIIVMLGYAVLTGSKEPRCLPERNRAPQKAVFIARNEVR